MTAVAFSAAFFLASGANAQTVHFGAKGGINSTSVNGVPDYYDFLLCCHPLFPDARVDATRGRGFTAGGFVAWPIHERFAVQTELMLTRRRHSVNLQPYEPLQLDFRRDYIEAFGLATFQIPITSANRVYVAGGPVFGFRVGEKATSSDVTVRRGDPETDIYVVQTVPYAAPELLRRSQTSLAVMGGWEFRGILVEVRFTQALQSMFKDREGIVSAFVGLGGDEPTLRRIVPLFGPSLEDARDRDVSVLAGFRF
jgi:hypothetical protein